MTETVEPVLRASLRKHLPVVSDTLANVLAAALTEAASLVPVVRGWIAYEDGSRSDVERWVKHADGDWVSLDTTRRTSGDLMLDLPDERASRLDITEARLGDRVSADALRRAAAMMRERAVANQITPSPWSFAGVSGQGFAVHHGEHDTVALYASRPDAAHIASWHPDVALAVADWLETESCEPETPIGDGITLGGPSLQALAVARAYMGAKS